MRYKQETDDAGERGRKRGDDDEGIEPRLKVDHNQEIDENDGEDESTQQTEVRGAHGLQLTLNGNEAAARQGLSVGIYNARDLAAHGSQVAALDIGVDIDDAPDVVMIDDLHLVRTCNGSDIRENLGARRSRSIERSVLEVFERLNRILWSLGNQIVAHTVLPIQKEHWRDLETAAERVQQAICHIALRVAALGCLSAVHGHIEFRVIKCLLYARIGDTRNALDFLQHPGGDFALAIDICSLDLDIDRSRQTKVQNLGDDVRRQKVKGRARVFAGQRLAQALNIVCGRLVIFSERHQD